MSISYGIGIVGLGPAGCFVLACLPSEAYASTVVFESGCIGGDLGSAYGAVVANLTCEVLCKAIRSIPRWSTATLEHLEGEGSSYTPDQCPRLADVALQLRVLIQPLLQRVTLHSQHIVSASQCHGGWRLQGRMGVEYTVGKLIVCTGGEPRGLDYPRPAIPLAVALDSQRLGTVVKSTDRVVVFGTAHSGTLILRNLRDLGCVGVTAVYGSAPPFRWARTHTPDCPCHRIGGTGCHDSEGLKQESAAIADAIVRGDWDRATPRLLCKDQTEELVRCILAADIVIYATGFRPRIPELRDLRGDLLGVQYSFPNEIGEGTVPFSRHSRKERYDPQTGLIAPSAWGFGLAYPALYEKPQGGTAVDVGLPGFAAHIQACLPGILNG